MGLMTGDDKWGDACLLPATRRAARVTGAWVTGMVDVGVTAGSGYDRQRHAGRG
jgi:hypothetical protein